MGYNVYFVEDEYMLREHIKANKIWSNGSYTLCGDASNGEDAWQDIQALHVDILITDIRMPFMDGLELSRLVRESRPEIKVIILSGYDDFAYAKQALALGVTDYLLKPLKPEDMIKTLDRAAQMIDEERRQKQSLSSLQEMANESLELNQQKFLTQLCTGFLPEHVITAKMRSLQLHLQANVYVGCILSVQRGQPTSYDESYLTFLDCANIIREFTKTHQDLFSFSSNMGQFRFIVLGNTVSAVLEKANVYMNKLYYLLQTELNWEGITAIIGNPCNKIVEIYASMMSAQVALGLLPQAPGNSIFLASDCNRLVSNLQYTSLEKEMFRNLLVCGTLEDVSTFSASITSKLEQEQMSHLYLTYVCLDILTAVSDFMKELGCTTSTVPDISIPSVIQMFDSCKDLSGFRDALRSLATQAIIMRDQRKGGKNDNVIWQARNFMQQHFMEPDIDLKEVAGHVNITPAYFSTLFKQETGQCFIEYLTFLRISKAKELLKTTQKRTGDIAFEVGYSDQNYFSKLFKKCTGMSAREFRQS